MLKITGMFITALLVVLAMLGMGSSQTHGFSSEDTLSPYEVEISQIEIDMIESYGALWK